MAAGAVNAEHRIEDLLRELAPQVLGTLVRRHGQFAACEDAVQEALLAAALQWPNEGVPDRPRSWLLTVANRSLVDEWRSESARRRREETLAALEPAADQVDASHWPADQDDTLALLFLCCHPALSPPSQLALTLRAVGGLTTTEIAAAFLVPEPTMAQRLVRAKRKIRQAGIAFRVPAREDLPARLSAVLRVVYLVFTEGHLAAGGDTLIRGDLCDMSEGPAAGLVILDTVGGDTRLARWPQLHIARAELLRRLGRRAEAVAAYEAAIALEPPAPERAYLARRMHEW